MKKIISMFIKMKVMQALRAYRFIHLTLSQKNHLA